MIPDRSTPVASAHALPTAFGMALNWGTCAGGSVRRAVGADVSSQSNRYAARGKYPRVSEKDVLQPEIGTNCKVSPSPGCVPRSVTAYRRQVPTQSADLRSQSGDPARMKFTGPRPYGGYTVRA